MAPKFDRRTFLIASGATAGLAAMVPSHSPAKAPGVRAVGLKVDNLDRPLGVESSRPRLSWRIDSNRRNVRQSAYRILVATNDGMFRLGRMDLWDSGKVDSRESFGIVYQGAVLQSRQRCWWCVEIWDEAGNTSGLSEATWWEMGLLHPTDWTAQWLTVENAAAKLDREVGLHWIWGSRQIDETSRNFRFKFKIPDASKGGQFFAVSSEATQIIGIWLDGAYMGGLAGARLPLKPMRSGEHLIAIEIATPVVPATVPVSTCGSALYACVELQNGEILRISSVAGWKTSAIREPNWYAQGYDDHSWEDAVPALVDNQPWPAMPAMNLRHRFYLDKRVIKARLYATALGAYEAWLNGSRVGDALLTPELSQYAKRLLYRVYDVTSMLVRGVNALGLTVGDGWYASSEGRFAWAPPPRRVVAQLELTFADGSQQVVQTGPEWRIAESPIRESEMNVGEVYDARFEQVGWTLGQFDDSHWQMAEAAEMPSCRLVCQTSPPIQRTQTLKPRTISQLKPGTYLFDFGQNFAGWCRMHVSGSLGDQVEFKFAELADQMESTNRFGMGMPKRDIFILRGDPSGEILEPHFTYRGFRYVQVTGLTVAPTKNSIEGLVVHSALDITGQFRADIPLIEQIWRNTLWSQRSNFVGIPTDCPSREQRGYMGDAGVFWDAAAFNMDVCAFTSRQMDNVVDDQAPDGAFPEAAPEPRSSSEFSTANGSPPAWGDGGIILPWTAWRRYGDVAIVERNWEAMNRYLQSILDHNPDYLWKNRHGVEDCGDWLAIGQTGLDPNIAPTTPRDLIGTAYWAHSADLLGQMAQALALTEDMDRLNALFTRVRHAFNEAFVKPDGTVGNGSQTSYILALKFGLLPEEIRRSAAERLAADIRRRGVSLTTGFLGTQFILDVLADAGYSDLVYSLLLRTHYPSWGYMIGSGATTMWETWSGDIEYESKIVKMSQNHFGLGSICGFLFRRVAGIDAATPGFQTIIIHPVLDQRVKRGGADYDSVMGRISADWEQFSEVRLTVQATIPANATARIHIPVQPRSRIEEGGRDVSSHPDVRIVHRLDHEAVIEVGSGTYRFSIIG